MTSKEKLRGARKSGLGVVRRALPIAMVVVCGLGVVACTPGGLTGEATPTVERGVGAGVGNGKHPTPFDTDQEEVGNLDRDLLTAVQEAARAAADRKGIDLFVNSGWRAPEEQQRLLDEAVDKYGSPATARRWVATPDTSKHVSGEAVDIGSWDAAEWLDENGNEWGLCRIYDNEAWHFELAVEPGGRCPRLLSDAAQG